MDLAKVLAHLHAELDNLDAAIASLERLQEGARRRGRPPGWMQAAGKTAQRRAGKGKTEPPKGSEPSSTLGA